MSNQLNIIAEVAQGYLGNLFLSKLYVDAACIARATYIKFQLVFADDLAKPDIEVYELYKSLEMSAGEWQELRNYCTIKKIKLAVDLFGSQSLCIAKKIKPDLIKIHSADFFNASLVEESYNLAENVIISLGGIDFDEASIFYNKLSDKNKNKTVFNYGFQVEPTPIELNNLARIKKLSEKFSCPIGLQDHISGDDSFKNGVSLVALGLGVRWFEKHLTLDRTLKLEDYISALTTLEFVEYVNSLHNGVECVGIDKLDLTNEEKQYRDKSLKKITAKTDLKQGAVITLCDLELIRCNANKPGYFLNFNDILDRRLTRNVDSGELITVEDLV